MHALDQWMMVTALTQLGTWQEQGLWPAGWTLSFNQLAQDITHPDWLGLLKAHLPTASRQQHCVQVELNESTLMQPSAETIERLRHMQQLGVTLSIDDFGTGYSSLSYLKNLPVSTLKIDQSFVRDMLHDPKDLAVVEAVVAMAPKMGFALVAEGVETLEQRQLLSELGCKLAQGFLVARGLSAEAFEAGCLATPLHKERTV
jgi:EAL domain-containing protein (putative c-di-GMP-specific phosphodiesterase class I)